MRSLLFSIVTGLIGAVVLHIVIIFSVPYFATGDAWSRLSAIAPNTAFQPIPTVGADALTTASTPDAPDTAPYEPIRTVVCRFDLAAAPVRLTATGDVPFWSLAVFDRRSNELFSMNDNTAEGARLDVALARPLQMLSLREETPQTLSQSILVETASDTGYVVLRTVVPSASWVPAADAFIQSARCEPVPYAVGG